MPQLPKDVQRDVEGSIASLHGSGLAEIAVKAIFNIFCEHRDRMFHWTDDRCVPAENNLAERQLRPTVIARKVSIQARLFGSQSDTGAKTREILMSILHTIKARGGDPKKRLRKVLEGYALGTMREPSREILASVTS